MTSLRKEAYQLLKRTAFEELLRLSKPIHGLDEEKELAQYYKKKFGYANSN